MHEVGAGNVLAPELVGVEMVAAQALDVFAERRRQRAFLGRSLAIGKTHRRVRIADMQRPHVGHQIAPGCDLDLDAEAGEKRRHVGDGLLQRQVLSHDVGVPVSIRLQCQQGLRIGIQILHFLDHEVGPRLHRFLHCASVNGTQDAQPVLGREFRRQLDLDLEDLLVAVLGIDNVVLRQADVFGGNAARVAVELHEVSRTQG